MMAHYNLLLLLVESNICNYFHTFWQTTYAFSKQLGLGDPRKEQRRKKQIRKSNDLDCGLKKEKYFY